MKRGEIEQLLPEIFRRTSSAGTPLDALLSVMEDLHAPAENALARQTECLDPYGATPAFVLMLARFVDLDRFLGDAVSADSRQPPQQAPPSTGMGRLREWICAAPEISRRRGTSRGLALVLEIATGFRPFVVDDATIGETGKIRPFHVCISAPPQAAPHRALIERIIAQEKAAFVTHELIFGAPPPPIAKG